MVCKSCGGDNINIQAVTETKTRGKGLTYWLFWFWFDIFIWIFLFIPRLIIGIFRPKKITSKTYRMAICQSCGKSWKV